MNAPASIGGDYAIPHTIKNRIRQLNLILQFLHRLFQLHGRYFVLCDVANNSHTQATTF